MARILIVDDCKDFTEMVTAVLLQLGHQPFTASLSDSLYRQLEQLSPDLVLLDIMLQGSDGRQLCHDLKSSFLYRNLPVLLLSASPQLLKYYRDFKADDYLEKPFDISLLKSKIDALCQIIS